MSTFRRNPIAILILICLAAGFIYGFLVGKIQIFPYQLIKTIYTVSFPGEIDDMGPSSLLKNTNLFPVRMTTYDWPVEAEPYSRGGGGITSIGDRVLGVEKNGEFFLYEKEDRVRLLGKSINTNIEALALRGNDPEKPETDVLQSFRFMDVEAKAIAGKTHIFVIYHYWHPDKECKTTRVSRLVMMDVDEFLGGESLPTNKDWQLIFESRPCLVFSYREASAFQSPNNGGRLALEEQRYLYISLGDHHLDGVNNPDIAAQTSELDYGKIIRVDLNSLRAEPYAYGIRNPQGMTIDAQGNLWVTEHGPKGGDELNLIKPGANYGWPLTTLGTQYRRWEWRLNKTPGRHEGFEPPTFAWVPSIGISNLIRLRDQPPLWRGDFLISALRTASLYRLRLKEGRVLFSEPIQVGERVRDLALMADGSVVLWTDKPSIIHVVAEPDEGSSGKTAAYRLRVKGVPEQLRDTVLGCMSCHSFSRDIFSDSAPPLWGVFGRPIGATDYPNYSNALRMKSNDNWDAESLTTFIRNPQQFAPGSTMPAADVGDARAVDALVDYLQTLH
jgi:cytochrome c2